jgi:O-antigen/teichoic acid export membrane protein
VISRQEWALEWNWRALWQRLWGIDFVRHVLTLSAGSGLAQFIVLGLSPLIARLYSPEAFGVFATYAAFTNLLALAATAQYDAVLMLPRYHRQGFCLLLFIVLLCPAVALILSLPLVIFRGSIATSIGLPRLALWLWLLPISVILFGWYVALRMWAMRRAAFADVAHNAVTRVVVGACLACFMGVWPPFPGAPEGGLILSQIMGEGFGNMLLAWSMRRRDRALLAWPGWLRLLATARRWRGPALSLTATRAVAVCNDRLPLLAIGWLFGASAAGTYAWAERFAVLPSQLVATGIGDVYRQRATVEYHRHGRFEKLMQRTLLVTTALAIVPFALGIALAPALFTSLFGRAWHEAGVLAQILLVGEFVFFVVSPVDKALLIHQRTRYLFNWHLARLFLTCGALGAVMLMDLPLMVFVWLIVLIGIILYTIDLVYSYHLARKGRFFPSKQDTLGDPR